MIPNGLGRDIWGNELTGTDRLLTGVGLALPMVPASALRRTGRFVGDGITDPMKYIRPIKKVAEQLEDPMKRVMDLPIIEQTFDVADEFLEKIGQTRACFVAGTQVVVADAPVEKIAAMSNSEPAEADDGLTTLALAAATVPVALAGYGRLRRRKRRETMSELDELFAADDLFPEPSAPPPRAEHTTPADPPRRHARSRFGPTLALAWLVGWLAVGGFLFVQRTAPADRPGPAPAVAASAPVEEAPAYRTKNIEDLQPDELVLAADPQSGRVEPKRVLEVYRRTSNHLRLLTFADRSGREQRIETTDEHPFWLPDRDEFVDAGDLSAGDKVVGPHGELQWLVSTAREPHPEGIEVFNFKVEDFHTYFVAAHGRRGPPALVHNTDCYPRNSRGQFMSPNGAPRAGRPFEEDVTEAATAYLDNVVEQVSIVPRLDSGELADYRVVVDTMLIEEQVCRSFLMRSRVTRGRAETRLKAGPCSEAMAVL